MEYQDEILERRRNAKTSQLDECRPRDIRHKKVGNTYETTGPKRVREYKPKGRKAKAQRSEVAKR
jgi:hypothetical protein